LRRDDSGGMKEKMWRQIQIMNFSKNNQNIP